MRILIDTNVILDIVQKREPFFADSYQALHAGLCRFFRSGDHANGIFEK